MSKNAVVAIATEKVSEPVEFTGVINSVGRVSITKDEKGNKLANPIEYISLDIEGLPQMYDDNGRKVSLLRTKDQIKADLRYFANPNATMNELEMKLDMVAKKREVTFLVSAHAKGAEYVATKNSRAVKDGFAEEGEVLKASKPGFLVEGFLNIDFSQDAIERELTRIENARAKSNASATTF